MKNKNVSILASASILWLIASGFAHASEGEWLAHGLVKPSQKATYVLYKQQRKFVKSDKFPKMQKEIQNLLNDENSLVYIDCVFQKDPNQEWINTFIRQYCTDLEAIGITVLNRYYIENKLTLELSKIEQLVKKATKVILLCSEGYPLQHDKEVALINNVCGPKQFGGYFVIWGKHTTSVPLLWREYQTDGFTSMNCGFDKIAEYNPSQVSYVHSLVSTACLFKDYDFRKARALAEKFDTKGKEVEYNPYL